MTYNLKLSKTFSVGESKRPRILPNDFLFISLTVFKHQRTLDFLARIFNCKGANFERMILRFFSIISSILYRIMAFAAGKNFIWIYEGPM